MRISPSILVTTLLALPATLMFAQEKPPSPPAPAHFYRLVYQVEECDTRGRVTNMRAFSTSVRTGDGATKSIRTRSKEPRSSGDGNQFTYLDTGIDIDTREPLETGSRLSMHVSAVVNSLGTPPASGPQHPVIRENRWEAEVDIPIGKPTVIFASDNLDDTGRLQMEVTATKIE